jgi:hypothetical protein
MIKTLGLPNFPVGYFYSYTIVSKKFTACVLNNTYCKYLINNLLHVQTVST